MTNKVGAILNLLWRKSMLQTPKPTKARRSNKKINRMTNTFENSIIIKSNKQSYTVLSSVNNYLTQEHFIDVNSLGLERGINEYTKKDTAPLPSTEDREGYYESRHYDFWLSGLEEYQKIKRESAEAGLNIDNHLKVLDFGCASGRVLRHFLYQSNADIWGCDINEDHVTWCNKFLSGRSRIFQNTSLPHLQVEDNFFDIVYCLSVFTHIETFETSWLCEIRRILKPGGIAYITIHDETSWKNMPDWGVRRAIVNHPEFNPIWLETGFPNEKFVSRWAEDKSYTSNVFYKLSYIKNIWSRFFSIVKVIPMGSSYQTVLILKKMAE